ncbi:MAG TPA: VanZ family protein [Gemmatimonadales bacterium]|nr:VanZ family protein [Gemmatimonadales bacterium]
MSALPPLDISSHAWQRAGRVLAWTGLVVAAVATLTPMHDPRGLASTTPLFCLVCGEAGGADVVSNLLLFLPFALGLRLSGWSWGRCVAAAAAVSFTVEFLQFVVVPGRDASLSDVLTNTASGAIGAALGGVLPNLVDPAPTRAGRLVFSGLAGALALLALSAWLLQPDLPRRRLTSHLAEGPAVGSFDGQVHSVHLNGREMPALRPAPDARVLRRELAAGHVDLAVDAVSGHPPRAGSWLFLLRSLRGDAIEVSQMHRRALLSVPARAIRFRLFPPLVTLSDAFPADSGVPVTIRAAEHQRTVTLGVSYGGATRTTTFGITPAYGWVMLVSLPFGVTPGWVTAIGLALLYLPVGYWTAAAARPARTAVVVAGVIALTLGILGPAFGLAPSPWSEWVAALTGAATGWALRRAAAYLQTRCASPFASESSSS